MAPKAVETHYQNGKNWSVSSLWFYLRATSLQPLLIRALPLLGRQSPTTSQVYLLNLCKYRLVLKTPSRPSIGLTSNRHRRLHGSSVLKMIVPGSNQFPLYWPLDYDRLAVNCGDRAIAAALHRATLKLGIPPRLCQIPIPARHSGLKRPWACVLPNVFTLLTGMMGNPS